MKCIECERRKAKGEQERLRHEWISVVNLSREGLIDDKTKERLQLELRKKVKANLKLQDDLFKASRKKKAKVWIDDSKTKPEYECVVAPDSVFYNDAKRWDELSAKGWLNLSKDELDELIEIANRTKKGRFDDGGKSPQSYFFITPLGIIPSMADMTPLCNHTLKDVVSRGGDR